MITKEEYLEGWKALKELIDVLETDDKYDFFYGFGHDGRLGWWCIEMDYPSFLGETLTDAFKEVGKWIELEYDESRD